MLRDVARILGINEDDLLDAFRIATGSGVTYAMEHQLEDCTPLGAVAVQYRRTGFDMFIACGSDSRLQVRRGEDGKVTLPPVTAT